MQQIAEPKTCTIQFTDKTEQVKAFNHLIHTRASFRGVDKTTIIINESDCLALQNKDIHYNKIS